MAPVKKKQTFRDNLAKSDAVPAQDQAKHRTANEVSPLMAMALRFEELAYENHVNLDGRGAPYLAKMFARPVELSGIFTKTYRDGDNQPVPLPVVGRTVVKYFWDRAPWDRDGDVARQFCDPVMFEDVLEAVERRWRNRRNHNRLVAEGRIECDGHCGQRKHRRAA